MKLSHNMLFAHPVLSPGTTDFKDARFEAAFNVTIDDKDNLDIVASMTLACPDLTALLESGAARSGFFVICNDTYYNDLIEMVPGSAEYHFRASDFFGTVRLRPVVWSREERERWPSDLLHPEYGGAADFPAAAILGLGDEQRFSADRQRLRPFESIFHLSELDSLAPGEIAVDTDAEKIIIKAHPGTKGSIEGMRNTPSGRLVLLNSVYLPAVMHVLNDIATDLSRCERFHWFRVFEAKATAEGINLEKPEPLRDAQRLLRLPFLKIEAEKERLFA